VLDQKTHILPRYKKYTHTHTREREIDIERRGARMQTRVIGSGGGYLPWKSHPKGGALFQRIHKEKVCACVLCVSKRVTRVNAGKRLSCFGGCDAYLFLKSGESAPSALSRRLSIDDKSI